MAKRKQPYRFGVPAKYLAGLSDAAAKKRAAEIKRTAKLFRQGKLTPAMMARISKQRSKG